MRAVQLLNLLRINKLRIFTTGDMLNLTGMTRTAASQSLARLEEQELLVRIKRGVWVNQTAERINPYEATPYLAAPWPAYISLYSALADAGVIEELPQVIYAVTSHQPKKMSTPIGEFRFHHIPTRLVWGYAVKQFASGSYPVAEPEKAFLDLVYLSLIPRSPIQRVHKRSKKWNLDAKKLHRYAVQFQYPPLLKYLKQLKII